MKIYLDVCCLNRPFDDQTSDRIHMEAEAILTILKHVESSDWVLIGSGVINYEISKTVDKEIKKRLQLLAQGASIFIPIDQKVQLRATQIQAFGIRTYDALHIACAETGEADVMLSTDDKLIKIAKRNIEKFHIEIKNPLAWLQRMV